MSAPSTPHHALVTGGSRGIGQAVCEALLERGWSVGFCSLSPDAVRDTEGRLRERFGPRVDGRAVDVRQPDQVDAWVAAAVEAHGRLDCLVNNAGLGIFAPVDAIGPAQWREILDTNLSGAFYCIRAAAPILRQQGSGWIFNVCSLAGRNPFAGGAAYNASKFGLVGLSEAAMLDLRHDGVRVVAILPGSVDTGFGDRHPDRDRSWMLAPEDVARAVIDCLAYPQRALPSLLELRPCRPPTRS